MPVYQTKLDPEEALLIKTIIEKTSFPGLIVEKVVSIKRKMNNVLTAHEDKTGEVVSNEQPQGFQRVQ